MNKLVAVDIEAVGRQHTSVFCVAFGVADGDKEVETRVFFFPTTSHSANTLDWWTKDATRKKFYDEAVSIASKLDRKKVIKEMREYVDELHERLGKELVFTSDFPEFDLGLVTAMFSEVGELPIYLKDDSSPPVATVNHNTYLKALARMLPTESSTNAYKKMKLERPVTEDSHDAREDIKAILREAKMVFALI